MQVVDLGEFGQYSPGRATTLRRQFRSSGFVGSTRFEGTAYRVVSVGKTKNYEGFVVTGRAAQPPTVGSGDVIIDSQDFVTGADIGAVLIYDRVIPVAENLDEWVENYRRVFRRALPIFPEGFGPTPHIVPGGPGPFSPQSQILSAFGPRPPSTLYSAAALVGHAQGVRELVAVCQAHTLEHARMQLVNAMREPIDVVPLWGVHIDDTLSSGVDTGHSCYRRPFHGDSIDEWKKRLNLGPGEERKGARCRVSHH